MNRIEKLREQALRLAASGISVIPCRRDKTPNAAVLPPKLDANGNEVIENGRAKRSWDDFKTRIASDSEIADWFSDSQTQSIAVVGGAVSDGLLVLDFDRIRDSDPLRVYRAWWQKETTDLKRGIVWQETGSGGRQCFFRCPQSVTNLKLAWVADDQEKSGRKVSIETRGEGGYAIAPLSVHPSGGIYKLLHGDLSNIPTLAEDKVDYLLSLSRSLDEVPLPERETLSVKDFFPRSDEDTEKYTQVIARFRRENSIGHLLFKYGYTRCGSRYLRPGASRHSAPGVTVIGYGKNEVAYFHSTNDPMHGYDGKNCHDAFDIVSVYEYGGDKRAAFEAVARSYGAWQESERVEGKPLVHTFSSYLREPMVAVRSSTARSADIAIRRVNTTTGEIIEESRNAIA